MPCATPPWIWPVQQQRIEHGADIVDHAVARDLDLAGVAIDLDFADMAAVREVLDVGAIDRGRDQAGFHVLRQFGRVRGVRARRPGWSGSGWSWGWRKCRPAKLTSPASTSSRWAASFFALAMIFSSAPWNADRRSVAEREPPVPSPKNTLSVSPCTYSTSIGMNAERSQTSCLNTVSWPWPCVTLPEKSVTAPERSKRISAPSKPSVPARSIE